MKTTKKPQKDDYNININKSAMDSTFIETEEIKIWRNIEWGTL